MPWDIWRRCKIVSSPAGTENLTGKTLKVPQIGWNNIYNYNSVLFAGLKERDYVYAVHSYYAALGNETIATTDYVLPYSAALQKDNFYAVQFHPEKSGTVGETILKNFIDIP
jgi:glutamine amidotransferase